MKQLAILLFLIVGMMSCSKEMVDEQVDPSAQTISTRSTSSAIPLVEDLTVYVQQLESDGEISANISTRIQNRLDKVLLKLEQGKANKAIRKLERLCDYITRKVNRGKISPEVGTTLIDMINDIIEEIAVEDNDGDGYSVDEDCDDNNATINPSNTSGIDVYNAISLDTIMDQTLSTDPVNGDDNETNLLTPGTIVLYKTDQGRFGKLMINTYGYNINLQYLTYNNDGSTASTSTSYDLFGTFAVDLDTGLNDTFADLDIFWQQITEVERELTPLDNVSITLFTCE